MNDQQKRQLEREHAKRTAHELGQREELQREAWRLNAPLRRAARELVAYLDEAKP